SRALGQLRQRLLGLEHGQRTSQALQIQSFVGHGRRGPLAMTQGCLVISEGPVLATRRQPPAALDGGGWVTASPLSQPAHGSATSTGIVATPPCGASMPPPLTPRRARSIESKSRSRPDVHPAVRASFRGSLWTPLRIRRDARLRSVWSGRGSSALAGHA